MTSTQAVTQNSFNKKLTLLAFLLGQSFVAKSLLAVNVQQFSRSNSLVFEMLEDSRMENSHVYSDYDAIFTLGGSWVENPFVIKDDSRNNILGKPLPSMKAIHFGAGVYLKPWLMFGLTTGYNFFDWKTLDQTSFATTDSGSSSGLSDIELKTKIRLIREPKWSLSIMPLATIPTNNGNFDPVSGDSTGKNAFLSDEQVGYGGKILVEYLFSFIQVVANLGYKHNSSAKYLNLDYRDLLYTGLGAYIPLTQKIGLNAEFVRQWAMPISDKTNPNEFYLGASAGITRRLHAFAGVGLGNLFQKGDGNSFRASAGIKFIPVFWSEEQKPLTEVTPEIIQAAVAEKTSPPAAAATEKLTPELVQDNTHYTFNNKSNVAVVRFPHNSSSLPLTKNSAFSQVLSEIQKHKDNLKHIEIVGHTSMSGTDAYNQKLSEKRAQAVKNTLVAKGIPSKLITVSGKGKSEPVINESTPDADTANRRVEFKVDLL